MKIQTLKRSVGYVFQSKTISLHLIMSATKPLAILGLLAEGIVAGVGFSLSVFGVINALDITFLRWMSLQEGALIGAAFGISFAVFAGIKMMQST